MRSKRKITKQDDYVTRVTKLIPFEIVGLYWAIAGILDGLSPADGLSPGIEKWILTIAGAFCFIATPLYLVFVQKVQSTATVSAKLQIIISTISWPIYLYAMQGPFKYWELWNGQKMYHGLIATALLIFWVTVSGWITKKK